MLIIAALKLDFDTTHRITSKYKTGPTEGYIKALNPHQWICASVVLILKEIFHGIRKRSIEANMTGCGKCQNTQAYILIGV